MPSSLTVGRGGGARPDENPKSQGFGQRTVRVRGERDQPRRWLNELEANGSEAATPAASGPRTHFARRGSTRTAAPQRESYLAPNRADIPGRHVGPSQSSRTPSRWRGVHERAGPIQPESGPRHLSPVRCRSAQMTASQSLEGHYVRPWLSRVGFGAKTTDAPPRSYRWRTRSHAPRRAHRRDGCNMGRVTCPGCVSASQSLDGRARLHACFTGGGRIVGHVQVRSHLRTGAAHAGVQARSEGWV